MVDTLTHLKGTAASLLAHAILAAAKAHEESYDQEAAEHAAEEEDAARQEGRPVYPVDYSKFYRVSLLNACLQQGDGLGRPVFYLLHCSWNDALAWAEGLVRNSKSAEASPLTEQGDSETTPFVVGANRTMAQLEIDYERLVDDARTKHKYQQGTNQCIAFKHGAEWYRAQILSGFQAESLKEHQDD